MVLFSQGTFVLSFGYYTTDAIAISLMIASSYFVNYSFLITEFMLKLSSNSYHCQAILLDQ